MYKLPLLIFALFLSTNLRSQDIHSPAEILKIMEESKLSYAIEMMEESIAPPDRSQNLNFNNVYIDTKGDAPSIKKYKPGKGTQDMMAAAEMAYTKNDYKEALKQYKAVYESDKTFYKVITYIAQMNGVLKNWNEAEKYYKLAIEKNRVDYMAHWFLADVYMETNRKKAALKEITIAQILNRNNPRLKASFDRIYKANKLKTPKWTFNPQYELVKKDEKTIQVKVTSQWMAYALTKAVWDYEPGYKKSMGKEENSNSLLEEKECIMGLLVVMSNEKKKAKKKYPMELLQMETALENKMITEYIIYEIMLPKYPQLAYNLQPSLIESIADYVLKIRGGQQ